MYSRERIIYGERASNREDLGMIVTLLPLLLMEDVAEREEELVALQ